MSIADITLWASSFPDHSSLMKNCLMKNYKLSLVFGVAIGALCVSVTVWAQSPAPSRAASVIDSMPVTKAIDQVVISPDGAQVAYIVGGKLLVVPANGGAERSIAVEGELSLRDVCWSGDSKQIAFIA